MLVEFRVKNHRSLRDEQVLTLQAGPIGDKDDSRLRRVAGFSESLLPAAVIYGANASGKSNVLSGLAFMCDAVENSHRTWPPEKGIPRKAFAWGQDRSEPSLFEIVMLIDGVKYQYGFTVSDTRVLEEWLFAWPKGHQQKWFERDAQTFKFGPQLKGENKSIAEFTRENALFVSAAVQNNHSQLKPIFNWFTTIDSVNVNPLVTTNGAKSADRFGNELVMAMALLEHDSRNKDGVKDTTLAHQIKNNVRALLKNADTGITDIRSLFDEKDVPLKLSSHIQLKHQSKSADAWLPLDDESSGTRTLFRLAFPLFTTILAGSVILVDELEASLHPALAEIIVRQFNDPITNPKNAQLIFTTHDTNLLGTTGETPVLRRDQIWLTEKDGEGATTLYPLTDFKPRKAENLERGYLQGRYGAVPFLGNFSVRAE